MTATTGTSTEPATRVEGLDKVTGTAKYAFEYTAPAVAYAWVVQATVATGRVTAVAAEAVLGRDGVIAVISHQNAPAIAATDSAFSDLLRGPEVSYRGQCVALVVAETSEAAREAAARLPITYDEGRHDVLFTPAHRSLYKPEGDGTDTSQGDADAAFDASAIQVDAVYRTPPLHNHAMEPHASLAQWDGDSLTVHDSNQGGNSVRKVLATAFGIDEIAVRVVSNHVGGGFGSKGTPRPAVMLAAMAARHVQRPVKLALTRQQMVDLTGYRSPTIQHLRLGADADGRLRSISHDSISQTSTAEEFVEQCGAVSQVMYAAADRRTSQRVVRLDVAVPSWARAPGECPGMFALETAMDELAVTSGLDPIELRVRNEPSGDPQEHVPFSSRHLVECMRRGADVFGWDRRSPTPRTRQEGRWLVGAGVAASTYPTNILPSSARVAVDADGVFTIAVNATDIGTGARTALLSIAATALGVPTSVVRILIGDTDLPKAPIAGGSAGTTSWGWAVVKAARELLATLESEHGGQVPADGLEVTASTHADIKAQRDLSRHAFGAQFAEAWVDVDTGEVRVPRMVGVFAAGRIANAVTARSQLLGGMTWGLSMALHEQSIQDLKFGDFANRDLATYHMSANADVCDIEVEWLQEDDPEIGAAGTKGIGEIGIVGTAAAIGNAVYNATGVRLRETPMTLDRIIGQL